MRQQTPPQSQPSTATTITDTNGSSSNGGGPLTGGNDNTAAVVAAEEPMAAADVLAALRAQLGDDGFDELKALSAQYRTGDLGPARYVAAASAMLPPPAPFTALF